MSSTRPGGELERHLEHVIIGPPEHVGIEIREYDPQWSERFRREAASIHEALRGGETRIEHIGSTSVPGLAAKPIVDILLVLDDPDDEASYLPALQASGYMLRVREPDFDKHRMLRTLSKDVHVHVYPRGSVEIDRYLLLRERLRANAADRELYAATKRRLAAQDWPTMNHYAEAKSEVIEAILVRAAAQAGGSAGGAPGGAPSAPPGEDDAPG